MPAYTLKTQIEFPILGEIPVAVEYYYCPEEEDTNTTESVEVEGVALTIKVLFPFTGNSIETQPDLDLDQLDLSELEELCLEDAYHKYEREQRNR